MNYPTRILALDLETTGLSPDYDYVVQVGLALMEEGEVKEVYTSRVQPDADKFRISAGALTAQCGDWMRNTESVSSYLSSVFNAPSAKTVAEEINQWIKDIGASGLPVVAHNMAFDLGFWSKRILVFRSVFTEVRFPMWIDTLELARMVDPGRKSYALDAVCAKYDLGSRPDAHDALMDAILAGKLYHHLTKA